MDNRTRLYIKNIPLNCQLEKILRPIVINEIIEDSLILENYNKFILEYGFNQEKDIFIDEDLSKLLEELDELEKEINNEK